MNIRAAISTPLPWLTFLSSRVFGGAGAGKTPPLTVFPRTLRFTKEGVRYTVLLFLTGIAAINTANNLLYLVVAMLLSLIIISGIMSESTLRGLSGTRILPRHIYRGMGADFRLEIRNSKRRLPSYSFTAEEVGVEGLRTEPAYLIKLDGMEKTVRVSRYTFEKRGVMRLRGLVFKTRFPFGLFIKGRAVPAKEEVLVYPRVGPVEPGKIAETIREDAKAVQKKGAGSQLYGLRDYIGFDDSRHIHWKASARRGRLLTKEFEKEKEETVLIVFDNFDGDPLLFEDTVDEAASLAHHYVERGFGVGMRTLSWEIPVKTGVLHLHRILQSLATIAPAKGKGVPEVRAVAL